VTSKIVCFPYFAIFSEIKGSEKLLEYQQVHENVMH